MAIFIPPKGTDESLSSIQLLDGELVYNTTKKKFYTGDGVTSGGIPVFEEKEMDMSGYATKADIAGLLSGELDPIFGAISGSLATTGYVDDNYAKKSDIPEVSGYATKDELEDYATNEKLSSLAKITDVDELLKRIIKMSKDVDVLKREANILEKTFNPVIVKTDQNNELAISNVAADAIISNEIVDIFAATTLTVKSIDMNNCSITTPSASGMIAMIIDAKEDAAITNSNVSADLGKDSNVFEVHSAEVVKFDSVTFTGNTYNTIMTGQRATVDPKYIDIINCNFNETASHVNIWIGGWQNEAVVNIINCKFNPGAEQNIIFGDGGANMTKANSLTVNISNCEMTSTETNPNWHGFLGMQTLDSKTGAKYPDLATAEAINPFKNVIINISNVTVNGVKLTKDNFRMGESSDNQQLWIHLPNWNKNVKFADYPQFFPTIYIDGELISQLA